MTWRTTRRGETSVRSPKLQGSLHSTLQHSHHLTLRYSPRNPHPRLDTFPSSRVQSPQQRATPANGGPEHHPGRRGDRSAGTQRYGTNRERAMNPRRDPRPAPDTNPPPYAGPTGPAGERPPRSTRIRPGQPASPPAISTTRIAPRPDYPAQGEANQPPAAGAGKDRTEQAQEAFEPTGTKPWRTNPRSTIAG